MIVFGGSLSHQLSVVHAFCTNYNLFCFVFKKECAKYFADYHSSLRRFSRKVSRSLKSTAEHSVDGSMSAQDLSMHYNHCRRRIKRKIVNRSPMASPAANATSALEFTQNKQILKNLSSSFNILPIMSSIEKEEMVRSALQTISTESQMTDKAIVDNKENSVGNNDEIICNDDKEISEMTNIELRNEIRSLKQQLFISRTSNNRNRNTDANISDDNCLQRKRHKRKVPYALGIIDNEQLPASSDVTDSFKGDDTIGMSVITPLTPTLIQGLLISSENNNLTESEFESADMVDNQPYSKRAVTPLISVEMMDMDDIVILDEDYDTENNGEIDENDVTDSTDIGESPKIV